MGEKNDWKSLGRNLCSEETMLPAVLRDLGILQRAWGSLKFLLLLWISFNCVCAWTMQAICFRCSYPVFSLLFCILSCVFSTVICYGFTWTLQISPVRVACQPYGQTAVFSDSWNTPPSTQECIFPLFSPF